MPTTRQLAAKRLADKQYADFLTRNRKLRSDEQYASVAALRTADSAAADEREAAGHPRYSWLQAQVPRRHQEGWSAESSIVRGEPPEQTTIDPAKYAQAIYGERAQEVVDTARKHGASPNMAPVSVKYEYNPLSKDYVAHGGSYAHHKPAADAQIEVFSKSPSGLAATLAHELSHHINDRGATAAVSAHNLGPRKSQRPGDTEAQYSELPEVVASRFGRYVGSPDEVRARLFRRIKHWGAERGIIPRNHAEARALLERYGADNAPAFVPKGTPDKEEYHERQMLPWLIRHPVSPTELLQTVDAPTMRQLAATRLAAMTDKGDNT